MADTLNHEFKGFIRVERPELVDVQGKQYIRLPVTAKAVKIQGEHWGMQILIWAFKDTGLDINEYAYSSFGGAAQGANMVYYVDPTTLLPEYVHLEATPSLTADGTPGQGQQLEASRTEYVRPAAIPADPLADRIPWQLSWDLSVR